MSRTQMHGSTSPTDGAFAPNDALVDEFVLAYVYWREACTDVWHADRLWSTAPTAEWRLTFAAHGAALEREATAAHMYARTAARLELRDAERERGMRPA